MERNQRNKLFVSSLRMLPPPGGFRVEVLARHWHCRDQPLFRSASNSSTLTCGRRSPKASTSGAGFDGFVLWGMRIQPPGNELFIAVYIQRDRVEFVNVLLTWLRPGSGKIRDMPVDNNVAVLASQVDKKLYLRNKGNDGTMSRLL